jgi:hypothetical protein
MISLDRIITSNIFNHFIYIAISQNDVRLRAVSYCASGGYLRERAMTNIRQSLQNVRTNA